MRYIYLLIALVNGLSHNVWCCKKIEDNLHLIAHKINSFEYFTETTFSFDHAEIPYLEELKETFFSPDYLGQSIVWRILNFYCKNYDRTHTEEITAHIKRCAHSKINLYFSSICKPKAAGINLLEAATIHRASSHNKYSPASSILFSFLSDRYNPEQNGSSLSLIITQALIDELLFTAIEHSDDLLILKIADTLIAEVAEGKIPLDQRVEFTIHKDGSEVSMCLKTDELEARDGEKHQSNITYHWCEQNLLSFL